MPPVAVSCPLYGVLTTPDGNALVLTDSALLTVIVNFAVAVAGGVPESVTVTLTLLVPASVGVPLMWPLVGLIESPAGRPEADHEYVPVPPVAVRVPE